MFKHIVFRYLLQSLSSPSLKCLCSHLHHALLVRFLLVQLLGQVCIDWRAIVLYDHLPFVNCSEANKHSPASGWGVLEFFTMIPLAGVSSTRNVSTFMPLAISPHWPNYGGTEMCWHFSTTWRLCTHTQGTAVNVREVSAKNQSGRHSTAINPSSWGKCCHFLHKYLPPFHSFFTPSYIGVETKNILRVYFL